jgi:hypothetical protein
LLVALAVVLIAGVSLAVSWPVVSKVLFPDDRHTATNDGNGSGPGDANKVGAARNGNAATGRKAPGGRNATDQNGRPEENVKEGNKFPRRALVISVHNYLYANPVGFGTPKGDDITHFPDALSQLNAFRIPRTQIGHLSDAAEKGKARPPMKSVIEKALKDFLDSSRAQDRVMVFFIGHAFEAGDEAYLVPIEGELDNPGTLLPIKWVYNQLAGCKARQKVLVLDVSRFSPTKGLERPDPGPLGAKFEAALKDPPPGVQVWCACSAGQRSYETDDAPLGVFLEALERACKKGIENKIQKPEDPLPVGYFKQRVDALVAADLKPRKLRQVSLLAGREPGEGAAYDKNEPPPPAPTLASVSRNPANVRIVKSVLDQIGTPGVKASFEERDIKYDALPPFDAEKLTKYQDDADMDSPLHKAVRKARAVLWAVSASGTPSDIAAEVGDIRQKVGVDLKVLEEGFRAPAPAAENRFKADVENNERKVARIIGRLREALEELQGAGETRDAEPKRWQANYDFMLARLEAQIAFLYEYQSMLGQMRKELPPRDPLLHGGWRLAATTTLQGDSTGKKLARDSRKLLDRIAKDHAGTPWEVLAKREKLTALGLEWQPAR